MLIFPWISIKLLRHSLWHCTVFYKHKMNTYPNYAKDSLHVKIYHKYIQVCSTYLGVKKRILPLLAYFIINISKLKRFFLFYLYKCVEFLLHFHNMFCHAIFDSGRQYNKQNGMWLPLKQNYISYVKTRPDTIHFYKTLMSQSYNKKGC